jgi:heptosyltransferase-2
MNGSTASVSNKPERLLLVGLNWIGDTLMALPAVQVLRRRHPEAHLAVLVKPGLVGLWKLHGAPDEILTYTNGVGAAFRAARQIRAGRFDRVYVLPHSIRSALVPFLAGVPDRRGLPGWGRRWLLHEVIRPDRGPGRLHQGFEYADLLAPGERLRVLEAPQLILPAQALAEAESLIGAPPRRWLAVLPGAARGPAKRWPAGHFARVAERWIAETGGSVLLLGGREDAAVCDELAAGLGPRAHSLAGRTTLPVWAAALKLADVVLANDSGGMHLAAAVGTPVVAVFGMTDPGQTGPLGSRTRIVQDEGARRRDVARDSEEAQKRLAAISPERVYEALLDVVAEATTT